MNILPAQSKTLTFVEKISRGERYFVDSPTSRTISASYAVPSGHFFKLTRAYIYINAANTNDLSFYLKVGGEILTSNQMGLNVEANSNTQGLWTLFPSHIDDRVLPDILLPAGTLIEIYARRTSKATISNSVAEFSGYLYRLE